MCLALTFPHYCPTRSDVGHCCRRMYSAIRPFCSAIAYGLTGLVAAVNSKVFDIFLSFFIDEVAAVVEGISLLQRNWVVHTVMGVRLANFIILPFELATILREGWNMLNGRDVLDSFLRMVEGIAWLGDSSATCLTGLAMTGAVPIAATIATYTSGISSFLWIATIIYNVRHWMASHSLLKAIDAHKGNDRAALVEIIQMDQLQLKRALGRDVQAKIKEILDVGNQDGIEATVIKIRNRIWEKKLSHTVAIVSAILYAVALAVMFFTHGTPLLHGVLALGAFLAVVQIVYDIRDGNRFEAAMERVHRVAVLTS